jgi:hypothetical protein
MEGRATYALRAQPSESGRVLHNARTEKMRANAESFKSWLLADRGQVEMPGLYQKKPVSLAIQNHAILESIARSFFRAPESAR